MHSLNSYVAGKWYEATSGFTPLVDPCTETVIAQASSAGLDFAEALDCARNTGGTFLRARSFAERAAIVDGMYRALYDQREALIDVSVQNSGTTRKDAKFDVDGATAVLQYYASRGKNLGGHVLADGAGMALGRSARFWGQHIRVPLRGVAVLINAFNFPLWNFAEKAATAILAGMPILVKPATSTALVTERGFRALVKAGAIPKGVASLICGSTGDLLSRLGSQDVIAFTGSSGTARTIRSAVMAANTRCNIEADSLNAVVLAPDVSHGSGTWQLFVNDVRREITQKSGQKCTAVRRIFAPRTQLDAVQESLVEHLADTVTGHPLNPSVTMGPLASKDQLLDAVEGVAALSQEAEIVFGTGQRVDGVGTEPGKGYFFAPTLLRAGDGEGLQVVHTREVFGPVATLIPYDGSPEAVAPMVARGGGSLVTSVYSDDTGFVSAFIEGGGSYSGRLYLGSEKMASQAFGSGLVLPQSMHGGPGRAGGGEEMGDLNALNLYTQRVALQGGKRMVQTLSGTED